MIKNYCFFEKSSAKNYIIRFAKVYYAKITHTAFSASTHRAFNAVWVLFRYLRLIKVFLNIKTLHYIRLEKGSQK